MRVAARAEGSSEYLSLPGTAVDSREMGYKGAALGPCFRRFGVRTGFVLARRLRGLTGAGEGLTSSRARAMGLSPLIRSFPTFGQHHKFCQAEAGSAS